MSEDRQLMAIDAIKRGENVFVSGPAGVGKSYVAEKAQKEGTVVVAPTGVAALNVGGITAHKAFGLPVGLVTNEDYAGGVPDKMFDLFSRASDVQCIQIDEIGMLRADYFELMDYRLRKVRRCDDPFGGLQITGFGDFFQLEPIVSNNESQPFYDVFDSPYCFDSDSWVFDTFMLEKVYRQSDERQVKILNSLRTGDKYRNLALQRVKEECAEYENTEDTLHLCCYRKDADKINNYWFEKIDAPIQQYWAYIDGNDKWYDAPVDMVLSLKVGAKVLMCANSIDGDYVNGDRGTVLELGAGYVMVELLNGDIVKVIPNIWSKYDYQNGSNGVERIPSSTFKQMPIRLAYGMTIHKVQGMTLDKAAVHVGKGCFSAGQLYVALSRIRDIKNMSFVNPLRRTDLITSKAVQDFYASIKV